jgi:hypothetical protein
MSTGLPTYLFLFVVGKSATSSTFAEGSTIRTEESVSLVLRASRDSNIVLLGGTSISDVDIHLTLSNKWSTGPQLDRDLTLDDVGFLAHNDGERGMPFVHGAVIVRSTAIVERLLSRDAKGRVQLVLPAVPFQSDAATPFVWGKGRSNMLRVSQVTVSILWDEQSAH